MIRITPIILIVYTYMAMCVATFYIFDYKVPIQIPLVIIIFTLFTVFVYIYTCIGGFLVAIMLVFFTAPIIPLLPYLANDYVNWGWLPNLRNAINYDLNWRIAMTISVGSLGLLCGSLLHSSGAIYMKKSILVYNPLNMKAFIFFCFFAIFLSYLSAPNSMIFSTEYGGEQLNSIALAIKFPAAYLVSYTVFIALAIDLMKDKTTNSKVKIVFLSMSVTYVALFLQLLRGDREIFGLFIALMVLYICRVAFEDLAHWQIKKIIRRRLFRCIFLATICIILLLAVGIFRFSASHGVFNWSKLFHTNPWIMSLTSFAAFFSSDYSEQLLYGKTYLNYIKSLPPGIITNLLGVERSIEANNNLATKLVETGLTSGGAHVALVSLQNFGIFGLFFIMAIYGAFARLIENYAIRKRGLGMLVWLNLICVIPIWFWYGEMAAIRAVMAAIIIFGLFKISLFRLKHGDEV